MLPLRDSQAPPTAPAVTYALVASNTAVFLYQTALDPNASATLIARFGVIPYYLTTDFHASSLSTVITSQFLHGDLFHLAWNLWVLLVLGRKVEQTMGHARYTVFYLLTGVCAAAAHVFVEPHARAPMIGASGAISGLLGASLQLVRDRWTMVLIVVWFATQLALGLNSLGQALAAPIAFFAHIGGFVSGLLLAVHFARRGA